MTPLTSLKIAYIGSGSREWARKLMIELALCPDLSGDVAFYDIDIDSVYLNQRWVNWIQNQPGVAGDRHLAEFLSGIIDSPRISFKWAVSITPVSYRIHCQKTAPIGNQNNAAPEPIVETTLTENNDLAFQAFFNDPSHHLSLHAALEFFKKLLQLNHENLPAMAVT